MIHVHRRMLDATLVRQLRADARARSIARRLSATINRYWDVILNQIPTSPHPQFSAQDRMRATIRYLHVTVGLQLTHELVATGLWAHHSAARALSHRVKDLVKDRPRRERRDEPRVVAPGSVGFRNDGMYDLFYPQLIQKPPKPPGSEPTAGAGDEDRYDYSKLLIQPPSEFEIARIVGPAPLRLTKLFDADRTAAVVWQGIANGQDRRAIATDLAKVLSNDMNAARRVARTEGLRVATIMQIAASEQIPDLIDGYQVLATLDDRTRPEHRKRHGMIFHRNPHGNQFGFDKMPHPPVEADGSLAWNCRCMLCPVFADEPTPDVGYLLGTPYADDATRNLQASAV